MYHIIDGNMDNAFSIHQSRGLISTNIELDREIRDHYTLTVIGVDQGIPQLTGTATVYVRVIDINDNPPSFPKYDDYAIKEGNNN